MVIHTSSTKSRTWGTGMGLADESAHDGIRSTLCVCTLDMLFFLDEEKSALEFLNNHR